MKDTIYKTTISFSWQDVQAQAEDYGITINERQAKNKFESIRWVLRDALIEAGNRAICDIWRLHK
jgi:hypothetical protein